MHIGIDISQTQYQRTGVARFTLGLMSAIEQYGDAHEWCFYYHNHSLHAKNLYKKEQFPPHIKFFRRYTLETFENTYINKRNFYSYGLAKSLNPQSAQLDWFISSDWIEPPLPCKKATIVHDLIFRKYPETVDPYILATQQKRFHFLSTESSLVFVDSKSTQKDLNKYYPSLSDKSLVNYPGVDQTTTEDDPAFLETLQLKTPYILAVGKQEPRKNYERLIEAWLPLADRITLVIVGQKGWGDQQFAPHESLKILAAVSEQELGTLYRHAELFIFPSLYEGFGYPLLEAMKYGCPVIASHNSSLSEIGADAILACDPTSTVSIRESIHRLLADNTLQSALRDKGKNHAATFTWKRYYNILIEALSSYK